MAEKESANSFFVTPEAAKLAIARLSELKIHPHFSGYLAAVSTAAEQKRTTGLKVDFKRFYDDYLLVSGAPIRRPYLQPFSIAANSGPQLFNQNVLGSYAPSSLRGVAPILSVVEFRGNRQSVRHSLTPDHELNALAHLTYGKRVPATSLATFLFRDHRIPYLATTPIESIQLFFFVVFGYDATNKLEDFHKLYEFDPETFRDVNFSESAT